MTSQWSTSHVPVELRNSRSSFYTVRKIIISPQSLSIMPCYVYASRQTLSSTKPNEPRKREKQIYKSFCATHSGVARLSITRDQLQKNYTKSFQANQAFDIWDKEILECKSKKRPEERILHFSFQSNMIKSVWFTNCPWLTKRCV